MEHKESLLSGIRLGVIVSLCLVFVATCAHQTPLEKQIAAEVAQQEPVPPGRPTAQSTKEILEEADSLSSRQRQQLLELHARMAREAAQIRMELSKNRQVLLKSLVNPSASEAEIGVLKDRIVKLEQERTEVFLDSLEQAKRILGRWDSEDERFYRAFLMDPLQFDVVP